MFQTKNVEVFLKSAVLDTDGEKRIAKVRFHVTPITYELLQEVSPEVADRLFTGTAGDRRPSVEIAKADLVVNIPPQSMAFVRNPDYGKATLIPDCQIAGLSAQRLFSDNPEFSLLFNVVFEIRDREIVQDLVELLHEKLFISFQALQGELFEDSVEDRHSGALCRLCGALNPAFVTHDGKFYYCEEHSANLQEGETVKRIRDAAKAAAIVEEMQEEKAPPDDPILATDFNARNRAGRRRRS
jgi:hypothetical protein